MSNESKKTNTMNNDDLWEWLRGDDCNSVLESVARTILRRTARMLLPPTLLELDNFAVDQANVRAVSVFLWEFLNGIGESKKNILSNNLRPTDTRCLSEKIIKLFLQHCQDKRRTYPVSPYHAFYKHMCDVLRDADHVNTQSTAKHTYYAYSHATDLPLLADGESNRLRQEGFRDWPHPSIPAKDISENAEMLKLSLFYWNETISRLGRDLFLPVRDLLGFVNEKYDLDSLMRIKCEPSDKTLTSDHVESFSANEQLVGNHAHDTCGYYEKQHNSPEDRIAREQLVRIAERLALSWKPTTRQVFHWMYTEDKTMEEIAGILGYAGPSSIYSHKQKIIVSMQELRKQMEAIGSTAESFKEEFGIFFDSLAEYCKKSV